MLGGNALCVQLCDSVSLALVDITGHDISIAGGVQATLYELSRFRIVERAGVALQPESRTTRVGE